MAEALKITEASDVEWRPSKDYSYKSGDRPLEGYTIKRGIGRGGFGEVYYALSDGGKEVALKLIQRHLDVELRGVGQCLNLKSPHLVAIFDVRHNEGGENWVVMEHMAGASLSERLQKGGPMPLDEAFHWMAGIASAIDYLHQQGIVHRDLKPGNVFGEGDLVKLGDYGLSKFISASRRSGQTESVGTVHYMAPEISTGHYGKSIDIYAAAVIAFEMLTGEVPFDGESAGEILMKHLTAEPSLDKVPPAMRAVFAKALAKDPADRFDTATALLDALKAVHRGERPAEAPRPLMGAMPPPLPNAQRGYDGADDAYRKYLEAMQRVQAMRFAPGGDLKATLPPLPGTMKAKRRAVADNLWAVFMIGVLGAALPTAVYAFEVAVSEQGSVYALQYVWAAAVATLGAWGLLATNWSLGQTAGLARRVMQAAFGAGLGVVAFGLAAYFGCLPQLGFANLDAKLLGMPRVWEALWRDHGSVLLKFAFVFGLAFGVPNWQMRISPFRAKRFSAWGAIWPAALAMAASGPALVDTAEWLPFGNASIAALAAVLVQTTAAFYTAQATSAPHVGLRPFRRTPHAAPVMS